MSAVVTDSAADLEVSHLLDIQTGREKSPYSRENQERQPMMLFFQELSILLLLWDLASAVHDTQSLSCSIPVTLWFGSRGERRLSAAL